MLKESNMYEQIIEQLDNIEAQEFLEFYNSLFGTKYTLNDIDWDTTEG